MGRLTIELAPVRVTERDGSGDDRTLPHGYGLCGLRLTVGKINGQLCLQPL